MLGGELFAGRYVACKGSLEVSFSGGGGVLIWLRGAGQRNVC